MASNRQTYEPIARQAALKHGLDPEIFVRQINQESGFNPTAKSPAGAYGIAQIMPATAKGWGVDPADPVAALNVAAKNMAAYRNTYLKQGRGQDEATALALAAYNAGPGNVSKYGGVPPFQETQSYVKRIMGGQSFGGGKGQQSTPIIDINPPVSQQNLLDLNPRTPQQAFLKDAALGGSQFLQEFSGVPPIQVDATPPELDVQPLPLPEMTIPVDEMPDPIETFNNIREQFKPKPQPAAAPKPAPSDIGKEFIGGLSNPLTGYTRDVEASQFAGRPAYEIGQFIGDIGANIGGAVLGGIGGPVGAVAGGVVAGGALSGAAELQRQRLAGEPTDFGKAGGAATIGGALNAVPAIKQGARFLPRVAANTALQGGLQGAGSVAQQAIEQGTLTPTIDIGRTAVQAGIGGAGGAVGGAFSRVPAAQPSSPSLAARGNIRPTAPVSEFVPAPKPVQQVTPPVMPRDFGGGLDVSVRPTQVPEASTQADQLSLFAIPEVATVKDTQYTAKRPEGAAVEQQYPEMGADAAMVDLAVNPTDEAALSAAREALPGYGDENLRAIAQQVKQVYDEVPANSPTPEGVTQRLIAPKNTAGNETMGLAPKPATMEQLAAKTRQLSGSVDDMVAQGTAGSVVKSKADYDGLRARLKELPSLSKNRLTNMEDYTPDVVVNRGQELLNAVETGLLRGNNKTFNNTVAKLMADVERLSAGETMTPREFNAAQRRVADLELRFEKQNIQDQLGEVHPSLRDAWNLKYNEETGIGKQTVANDIMTLADVEDSLTPDQYNLAKTLDVVAEKDGRIRLDADTEKTGATSRIGVKELSPIGFRRDKDGFVSVVGYNEEGHIAQYYVTPKPMGDGKISKINRLMETLNQPAFRGEYANVYKGARDFSITDIMKRPPRLDGITTSEALAVTKRIAGMADRSDIMAANPEFAKLVKTSIENPRSLTIDNVNKIKEILEADSVLLKKVCSILGKAS